MNSRRKLKKTGFTITFEDGKSLTKYLQPLSPCFCDREIEPDELKEIIIELRKKSNLYEIPHFLNEIRNKGTIKINDEHEKKMIQ